MLEALNVQSSSPQIFPTNGSDFFDLQCLNNNSEGREEAEKFVQDIFYNAYNARVKAFYPLLLTIKRKDDRFAAVAGVRTAGTEKLFSENYLNKPIEDILSTSREKIVEIGNLAPADAGQARWLITTLSAFMNGAGFTHVVFTAVPKLRNSFRRMGLPLTELAYANPDYLPEEEMDNWGHYYDSKPIVCVGDLKVGQKPLAEIGLSDPSLNSLCQRATLAGQIYRAQIKFKEIELEAQV